MTHRERKKYLAEGLLMCGLGLESGAVIITLLRTEEQVDQMILWLLGTLKKHTIPTEQQLMKKALEIAGIPLEEPEEKQRIP